MDKKFYIRGFREKAKFPTFYDPEPYSLQEAISKSNEYFKKIKRLGKIMLFEQEEAEEKEAVIMMKKWRNFWELGIEGRVTIVKNSEKYYFYRGKFDID